MSTGFGKRALRAAHVDVHPLQPFRHSPLKYSPSTSAAGFETCLAHDSEDTRLLAGFDDDERKARGEQHLELTARILRHGWGSHAAKNVAELARVPCHAVTFF